MRMEYLDEIEKFVKDNGEEPKKDIGKLGEQFTKALFKNANIKKEHPPMPDFSISLNNKSFKLETTVIGEIYQNLSENFYEACNETGNKNIVSKYNI